MVSRGKFDSTFADLLPTRFTVASPTPDAFDYFLGRKYGRSKKAANDGGAGTSKTTVDQNEPRLNTAARIAAAEAVLRSYYKSSVSENHLTSDLVKQS